MDLRKEFEKKSDETAVFNSFSGSVPNMSYVEHLESQLTTQSTRIRELEVALGRVVRAYNETGEVASAIRGCEQSLNKKGAVRRKCNQGAK